MRRILLCALLLCAAVASAAPAQADSVCAATTVTVTGGQPVTVGPVCVISPIAPSQCTTTTVTLPASEVTVLLCVPS